MDVTQYDSKKEMHEIRDSDRKGLPTATSKGESITSNSKKAEEFLNDKN